MLVVSDTSPIRALEHLGLLEVLRDLSQEVLVPPVVAQELARGSAKSAAIDVQRFGFVRVQAPSNHALVRQLAVQLDVGESEALALAVEVRALVLMDELLGRSVAAQLGLKAIGTVGLLLVAKHRGRVSAIAPLLDRLISETGFFLSERFKAQILATAGENPK